MDNNTLKRLFHAGAILLVLDAPQGQLEFGIDVNCWNTGPRFKGIKIIPPGPHFVFYTLHATKAGQQAQERDQGPISALDDDTIPHTGLESAGIASGSEVRRGFWHVFEGGEVVVLKWNAYDEEMELETDQEQIARYKSGIQEFDPFLGAYPLLPPDSTYPAWLKLANHIQKPTLDAIFLDHGFVNSHDDQLEGELARATKLIQRQATPESVLTPPSVNGVDRTTSTIVEEDEDAMDEEPIDPKPSLKHGSERKATERKQSLVTFTPIDLRSSFQKGAVGEEVTRYSLDKSWLLNQLYTNVYGSDVSRFLGEYQVAFVTMLLSYHLGAFHQWKTMTILMCQSMEALPSPSYRRLFFDFIQCLDQQLSSLPTSFFMDLLFASPDESDMTANFLELALKTLARNIHSALRQGECQELRRPMRDLQKSVLSNFEWKIAGNFEKGSKVTEIQQATVEDEDDDDYEEEGEYAPVIVEQ